MSSTVVTTIDDSALPALARALDTEQMLPYLARICGLQLDDLDPKNVTCSAQVLNHKRGRRCTIRYELAACDDIGGPARSVAAIGKLYRERETAARMFRWIRDLRNDRFDCVPTHLAFRADLGLVLQEHVDAPDLRHCLAAGNGKQAVSLAAQWLSVFHATPPPMGVKVETPAQNVRKVARWCEEIQPYLASRGRRRLQEAQDALQGLVGQMPRQSPALIHRDFYPANVLSDGQRIWVLDFDQLRLGDPALDVGHFLAHVQNVAYRATGRADSLADAGAVFLRSYLRKNPLELEPRLRFYRAWTFLKLAAKEANRKRGEWLHFLSVLTELACREAEMEPES